jgi:hypothetical protein
MGEHQLLRVMHPGLRFPVYNSFTYLLFMCLCFTVRGLTSACAFRASYDNITEALAIVIKLYRSAQFESRLDTGYPEIFRGLPQSLQADAETGP